MDTTGTFRRTSARWMGAALCALCLAGLPGTAPAQGEPAEGNGGGFEIDSHGALLSGNGAASGILAGDDWAQGPAEHGVLDVDGNAATNPMTGLPFNAARQVDQNWGNMGDGFDATQFDGGSNKNDDFIGNPDNPIFTEKQEPWTWNDVGGGPQKNDITNTYFHTREAPFTGDLWVFLGAETRSIDGDSHVDFEFNQAGVFICPGPDVEPVALDCSNCIQDSSQLATLTDGSGDPITAGLLIGHGPDNGRTVGDFIVSIDFLQGGDLPIASVHQWNGTAFQAVSDLGSPPNILAITNLTDVCNDGDGDFASSEACGASAGDWVHYTDEGAPTSTLTMLQLVEVGINLDGLSRQSGNGFDFEIDPCATNATFLAKTRSSDSFTAELKDWSLTPFPLQPIPECMISGPTVVCPGASSVEFTVSEITGKVANPSFLWTISGDGAFCGGETVIEGDRVCVDVDLACEGLFDLIVSVVGDPCTDECTMTVDVRDTDAPEIDCPPDEIIEAPATPVFGTPTVTDECPVTPSLTSIEFVSPGSCEGEVRVTRRWFAMDLCGNVSSCEQTITVLDRTPPTISGSAAGGEVDANCEGTATFSALITDNHCVDVADVSVTPALLTGNATLGTASCTKVQVDAMTVSVECSVPVTDLTGCPATVRFTVDAQDCCGNAAIPFSDDADIVDLTPPTITCPGDETIEAPASPEFGLVSATDNCDTDPEIIILSTTTVPGGCSDEHSVIRTWVAEDNCGNRSDPCSQEIRVVDTTAPTLMCPPDETIECPASPEFGMPKVTDTLDPKPVIRIVSTVTTPGSCPGALEVTRTWEAEDRCGNVSDRCSQTITVIDTTPPGIACSASGDTVDAACEGAVTFSALVTDECCLDAADVSATPTLLSGNATLGTPDITISQIDDTTVSVSGSVMVSDLTGCPATVRITVNANDCCGNTATACTADADVVDSSAPSISLSATGGTVDANCEGTATLSALITDNCSIDAADVTVTRALIGGSATLGGVSCTKVQVDATTVSVECSVPISDVTDCPATVRFTVNASDRCSNPATPRTADADVLDATEPTISCSATGDSLDSNGEGTVTLTATVTDNCCLDAAAVTVDAAIIEGSGTLGTLNCTPTQIDEKTVSISCSVTVSEVSTNPLTVRFTVDADDCCGNAAVQCVASADVVDLEPPTILECDAQGSGDCLGSATYTATVTDNCCISADDVHLDVEMMTEGATLGAMNCNMMQVDPWTVSVECSVPVTDVTSCPATVRFTLTAMDRVGNDATCVDTADVADLTPPIISCPGDETVECDERTNFTVAAWDNCDPDPEISWSFTDLFEPDRFKVFLLDNNTIRIAVAQDNAVTVTATATDSCGNSASCQFTLTADCPSGEGCTPGFWRQPQHFDLWPDPFTHDTLFSDVFEDAFPGMTLAQVLKVGGGHLNALGRHTVAALLNAAHSEVDYGLTPEEVIQMFNDVYPGSRRDYNELKNQFRILNQRRCDAKEFEPVSGEPGRI